MPTQNFIIVHAVINMKPAHRNMLYSLDLLAQKSAYLTKKIIQLDWTHPSPMERSKILIMWFSLLVKTYLYKTFTTVGLNI